MRVIIRGTNTGFGIEQFPNRKNPSLFICGEPNWCQIVGNFKDEKSAEKFMEVFRTLFSKYMGNES